MARGDLRAEGAVALARVVLVHLDVRDVVHQVHEQVEGVGAVHLEKHKERIRHVTMECIRYFLTLY